MTDDSYAQQAEAIAVHIQANPAYTALLEAHPMRDAIDPESLGFILEAAGQFAERVLEPVNRSGDRAGARLEGGNAYTPEGYPEAWRKFVDEGWHAIDQPEEYGGQGLPSFVNIACRELFDRAAMAFGMATGTPRAATLVLLAHGSEQQISEWVPKWVDGSWGATLGISEADAGSDVGRVRTTATPQPDGTWLISGEKMWTSFGDSDMVDRIGCLLLARTPGAAAGSRGLSLFLVPDLIRGDDGQWDRNNVFVRRIEEKLGLHGSPTCVMGFEGARATLIGEVGRGLPQMFTMIQQMRLLVAAEGVGISHGAASVALAYSFERAQGGRPDEPPVLIAQHPEVQRILLTATSRVEALRALLLEVSLRSDVVAAAIGDAADIEDSRTIIQWLLPILKALAAEAAFEVSSEAMQVLGGAGYTQEWPVEQWLRDSRMMSIAEGTTGIQALDLVLRRLIADDGASLSTFLRVARTELAEGNSDDDARVLTVLGLLETTGAKLLATKDDRNATEARATAFLRLSGLAATGWLAARLTRLTGEDSATRRVRASAGYWLSDLDIRARSEADEFALGGARLSLFSELSTSSSGTK